MAKRIITAAITGSIHVPSQSPYLPYHPEDIIQEAVNAYEAGAAVVHIHARDPQTGRPSADIELFRSIAQGIKRRCPVVQCITTGGGLGMSLSERISVVPELRPELASLNTGSINFVLYPMADKIKEFQFDWEHPYLLQTEDLIFANTYKAIQFFGNKMKEFGTQPELEVYDVGHINNIRFFVEKGVLKKPVYIQFVLGILGGIPATSENLQFLLKTAKEQLGEFNWSVAAAGKAQMSMGTAGLLLGGNVRVGLEDSLYLEKGRKAVSNADQVKKIKAIAESLGIETATPDEAREILHLKGIDAVQF
ncbi:MAG: 3-keto-5-aminohexanoate cleavage protein [Desulfitobacteriaceae bacterium]|nr:3-keto-5-aminohexanoate cleavage protein [Desulfitobacteriaceae bacterium]